MTSMKRALIIFTSCLLLFNGIGAIYGGYELFTAPDGSTMKMPLSMLAHSPFVDFFIPGLILFITNGVFSLLVLTLVLLKYKHSPVYVLTQGVILISWIVIQALMLQAFVLLHFIFISVGLLLFIIGLMLMKN